jgi:hypothetical protein
LISDVGGDRGVIGCVVVVHEDVQIPRDDHAASG